MFADWFQSDNGLRPSPVTCHAEPACRGLPAASRAGQAGICFSKMLKEKADSSSPNRNGVEREKRIAPRNDMPWDFFDKHVESYDQKTTRGEHNLASRENGVLRFAQTRANRDLVLHRHYGYKLLQTELEERFAKHLDLLPLG